PRRLD
ncbi:hypothetical protein D046_7212B, partial [Vibrio parahaemolyticus V-223/04]